MMLADHQISYMAIPTLEDLKQTLFPAGNLIIELGYPFKVTTKGDIETAAFLAEYPRGAVGHYSMITLIISSATKMVTRQIHSFTDACTSQGGTTKIFDANGTELSPEGLLKKYYVN